MKPVKPYFTRKINVENQHVEFCKLWNDTKKCLDLLAEIEDNPAARKVLHIVKEAGDAIVRQVNN